MPEPLADEALCAKGLPCSKTTLARWTLYGFLRSSVVSPLITNAGGKSTLGP